MGEQIAESDVKCPACGTTTWVQHPRLSAVLRCSTCAEWQPLTPPEQTTPPAQTATEETR